MTYTITFNMPGRWHIWLARSKAAGQAVTSVKIHSSTATPTPKQITRDTKGEALAATTTTKATGAKIPD